MGLRCKRCGSGEHVKNGLIPAGRTGDGSIGRL